MSNDPYSDHANEDRERRVVSPHQTEADELASLREWMSHTHIGVAHMLADLKSLGWRKVL